MYLPTAAHIIRRGLLIAGMTALASLAGPLARAPHFAASAAPREASEAGFDHTHSAWTRVLAAHVRDGWVDYAGLHRRPEALDAYLASLAAPRPEEFRSWSEKEQLAFWINAYNAWTVRLILDNYPLESIRSIGLLPGAAFRSRFIPLGRLRGSSGMISLNDIEHGVLRPEFREPRIHFAIVCASAGCPALRSEAYRAADLESQLDDAARDFLRDTTKNRFDSRSRTLHLSSIFKWFGEDFETAAGSLESFVGPYLDEATRSQLDGGEVTVSFLDYDWTLNGD